MAASNEHLHAARRRWRARRADDPLEARAEFRNVEARAVSETEAEQRRHSGVCAGAGALPFFAHGGIVFVIEPPGAGDKACRIELRERPHRGATHQRDASFMSRSTSGASDGSAELPIAISTLRMKRSRPLRLTGDFANSARKAASSRRASSASGGARNASRAASFASRPTCAYLFQGHTARQSSQP
jgi:hypothetical protein